MSPFPRIRDLLDATLELHGAVSGDRVRPAGTGQAAAALAAIGLPGLGDSAVSRTIFEHVRPGTADWQRDTWTLRGLDRALAGLRDLCRADFAQKVKAPG